MELTRSEENKYRAQSGIITALLFSLILLFLIWFQIVTPNPPFPESGAGGGGQEMAIGLMMAGTEEMDYTDMGTVTDVVTENTPVEEEMVTDPDGEVVPIEKPKDEKKEEKKTEVTPVEPKPDPVVIKPIEKRESDNITDLFKNKKGTGKGSKGSTMTPGEAGDPNGIAGGTGTGGTGTGKNGGDGVGEGPGGPGPGSGGPGGGGVGGSGYSANLTGRAVVTPPKLPKDTKEEGKVVVEITVDSQGNVIEATPTGRGTNTSSAVLKKKAVEAAMNTKFNVDGKFEEQRGTITIVFSFN